MQPDITLPKEKAILTYKANLTQTTTGAPVPEILFNNGLEITWTRTGAGIYSGEITNYPDIITRQCGIVIVTPSTVGTIAYAYTSATENTISLVTLGLGGSYGDNYLDGTSIEIEIITSKTRTII